MTRAKYAAIFLCAFVSLAFGVAACAIIAPVESDLPVLQTMSGRADWSYVLVKPKDTSRAAPVLLVLHGYDGDARSMAQLWSVQREMNRAYILAPQAPPKERNGKTVSTWEAGTDDAFLHTLLDKVSRENKTIGAQSAIAGYSAGASMAMHMAMKNPGRFAACAAIGGGVGMSESVDPGFTHYLLLAGERDVAFDPKKATRLHDRIHELGGQADVEVVKGADHTSLYGHVEQGAKWLAQEMGLLFIMDE